jgi:hypothetical protein
LTACWLLLIFHAISVPLAHRGERACRAVVLGGSALALLRVVSD